jgi:ATP-dependent RNA helicase DDX42
MKKKVESFAREILNDPVRVVVGTIGQANPDIQQVVEIFQDDSKKWAWLASHADEFVAEGKVLIFVSSKLGTENITESLRNHFIQRQLAVGIECLHGDKDQNERTLVMKKFSKTEETAILVATDVAARGLDVKNIRTVINYEAPKNIETYVHRIGRTGRMGQDGVTPGTAFTLLTVNDSSFAVDLVSNLTISGLEVPIGLQKLASTDPKFIRVKHHNKNSSNYGIGSGFHNKAMTSSMAAENSKGVNNISIKNNFNHLYNTESFMNQSNTSINSSSHQKKSPYDTNPESSAISGFVRAKESAHQGNSTIVTEVYDNQPKKRSRWDN